MLLNMLPLRGRISLYRSLQRESLSSRRALLTIYTQQIIYRFIFTCWQSRKDDADQAKSQLRRVAVR